MSTGGLGYVCAAPSDAQGDQLPQLDVELRVCGLGGEELIRKKFPALCTGQEVREMVAEKLPSRPGAKCLLYQGVSQLMLDKTLQAQGIVGPEATLTYTLCSMDLCAAWSFVQGRESQDPLAVEGLTCIQGATTSDYLRNLPKTLQSLRFGDDFNKKLEGVTFQAIYRV